MRDRDPGGGALPRLWRLDDHGRQGDDVNSYDWLATVCIWHYLTDRQINSATPRNSLPTFDLRVSASYWHWAHCRCVANTFGIPPSRCYRCPPGANCSSGGNSLHWERG